MKHALLAALLAVGTLATDANANSFLNGGFEDGNTGSWATGGRSRANVLNSGISASYFLAGSLSSQVAIVTPGSDPNVGAVLNQVFAGNYSVRIGDTTTGGNGAAIRQSVAAYGASTMNFSWAAVLEPAHSASDAPFFFVRVVDTTTNTEVYKQEFAAYPGAPSQGLFQSAASGYVYAPWQSISINTVIGNNYTMELYAADCEPTGHLGYAYLDGFGSVAGGGGDNGTVTPPGGDVPVPGTLALLACGLGLFGLRRKA